MNFLFAVLVTQTAELFVTAWDSKILALIA
jgi:hypothetical protein